MTDTIEITLKPFAENGWLAKLEGAGEMVATALKANRLADILRDHQAIIDSVAGIDSVVIRFDATLLSSDDAKALLETAAQKTSIPEAVKETKTIDIPVCYGGEYGPDFDGMCNDLNLSPEDLIARHAAGNYVVVAVGFAPGFAYLGPLDPSLEAPRLDTPRSYVPAGSVGVAGGFTAVYPLPSPGGWRLIGRTPLCLFDPSSSAPFKFKPGARVRFQPVDEERFLEIEKRLQSEPKEPEIGP